VGSSSEKHVLPLQSMTRDQPDHREFCNGPSKCHTLVGFRSSQFPGIERATPAVVFGCLVSQNEVQVVRGVLDKC
jgi:hypothetical protein